MLRFYVILFFIFVAALLLSSNKPVKGYFSTVHVCMFLCLDWIFATEWRWQHKLENS